MTAKSLGIWMSALTALTLVPVTLDAQRQPERVEERTAATHPMHYFVSLPDGWTSAREWPVLVVIPDAYREFAATTSAFATARGALPFVIVTPMVLSGGGPAQQHVTDFDYESAAWDRAARDGNCGFDADGLSAVLTDVRQRYRTEPKAFITGWEAGGHVVLAQVLNNPERFRGAVVVTPNFQGRCVSRASPGRGNAATQVPIRELNGSLDTRSMAGPIHDQWMAFEQLARARGFTDIRTIVLPGRDHGALAADVFGTLAPVLDGRARL